MFRLAGQNDREFLTEPEKPTEIPHLWGNGTESFLEDRRGNKVYTRRRVHAAREEVPLEGMAFQ
jgi:hypothetical protein